TQLLRRGLRGLLPTNQITYENACYLQLPPACASTVLSPLHSTSPGCRRNNSVPRVRCRTLGRLSVGRAFQDSLILLKSLLTACGACSTLVTYFTKTASRLKACTT